MTDKKSVLAICGSTRINSTNLSFIKAIQALTQEKWEMKIFSELAEIPHFNPDLDHEPAPKQVAAFRNLLRSVDGILICTPEYAMGVPGTLKNAIDWTVSSMEFSHKPTALITASSVGQKGHASLLETLKVIESEMSEQTQLLISFAKTKINSSYTIIDDKTFGQVQQLIGSFHQMMTEG
jgi:chromate reductase, NAD(P)H dehydrogenase (quinone)